MVVNQQFASAAVQDLDWSKKLASLQRRRNLNYFNILKEVLTTDDVIADSHFFENGDESAYGSRSQKKSMVREYLYQSQLIYGC